MRRPLVMLATLIAAVFGFSFIIMLLGLGGVIEPSDGWRTVIIPGYLLLLGWTVLLVAVSKAPAVAFLVCLLLGAGMWWRRHLVERRRLATDANVQ